MKVPCIVFIVCEVNPIIVSYHSLVKSQYCLVSRLQTSIFTDSLQATALLIVLWELLLPVQQNIVIILTLVHITL